MSENVLRFDFLATDRATPVMDRIERKTTVLGTRMAAFGRLAVGALGSATVAAGGLAGAGIALGIKTAAGLEQAEIGFTALLKSGSKARSFLGDLKTFAATTPFELQGLIDSSRTLIGVGLNTKQTMSALKAFGDAASAVGVGQEAFQRIMLATSQAVSAGKFGIEDLNQITENGIPIWKVLADATGKPVPKLRELATEGKLLAKDVLPLLEKQMGKDYGGAMAKQSKTLNGLWSTFTDTLSLGLADAVQPMIPALKTGLAGASEVAGDALARIPGILKDVQNRLGTTRDFITDRVVPTLKGAFGGLGDDLPDLDLGGLGRRLRDQAEDWGGLLILGIGTGLRTGDWGHLGSIIGNGLSTALAAGASQGADVADAVAGWVASVDWLEVGKTAGRTAIPFGIGFTSTLVDGLFTAIREHPLDVGLAVLALIPIGKFAAAFGPLRRLIERLPLGGWLTKALDRTAVPVFDAAWGAIRWAGRGIARGFREVVPSSAGWVRRLVRSIGDGLALRAFYMADRARDLIGGIFIGIGRMAGRVAFTARQVIGWQTRPFANAGRWLIDAGRRYVVGLVSGVTDRFPAARAVAGRVIDRVTSPFRSAGRWLIGEGRSFVGGLTSGIRDRFGAARDSVGRLIDRVRSPFARARSWLFQPGRQLLAGLKEGMYEAVSAAGSWARNVGGRIVSAIKRYFGIRSPSRVFTGIGRNLIGSMLNAMVSAQPVKFISRIFGGMPQALGAAAKKGLIPISSLGTKAWKALSGLGGKFAGLLGGGSISGGWKKQWDAVRKAFPGAVLTSSTRPGSITSSGNKSYHASGRAIDISPSMQIFNWIRSTFGSSTKELIFSPAGPRQIKNGRDHNYTGAVRADHWDHVHWAYDQGGLARGRGVLRKDTVAPERVLSPRQTVSFERLVRVLDRGQGAGAAAEVHYHFPNYIGTREDLLRTLQTLDRQGRLQSLKRR